VVPKPKPAAQVANSNKLKPVKVLPSKTAAKLDGAKDVPKIVETDATGADVQSASIGGTNWEVGNCDARNFAFNERD
jgi:hypothetical protein